MSLATYRNILRCDFLVFAASCSLTRKCICARNDKFVKLDDDIKR
jgi:hypothetical protein